MNNIFEEEYIQAVVLDEFDIIQVVQDTLINPQTQSQTAVIEDNSISDRHIAIGAQINPDKIKNLKDLIQTEAQKSKKRVFDYVQTFSQEHLSVNGFLIREHNLGYVPDFWRIQAPDGSYISPGLEFMLTTQNISVNLSEFLPIAGQWTLYLGN